MRVYEELICEDIGRHVLETLHLSEKDFIDKADTKAIEILEEIKNVLHSDLSDFDTVEKIVSIFEEYNIDCGGCHDFG